MDAIKQADEESQDKELQIDLNILRERSKRWSPEEWESYLESIEMFQREEPRFIAVSDEPFSWGMLPVSDEGVELVSNALKQLTAKQRFVIEKIFFDRYTESQIAKMMGISRQGVCDYKRRSLKRMKKYTRKSLAKFRISRGPSCEDQDF